MPTKDVYGQAIYDFWENGYETDPLLTHCELDGTDIMPVDYLFRGLDRMPQLEKLALQQCTGKILEIGAGAGSHALILQHQNLDVTALEISSLAAEVMLSRGVKKVVNQDVFLYKPTEQYDTILMIMNGIGLAKNIAGLNAFFRHIDTWLLPGGQVICDSCDLIEAFREEDGSYSIDLGADYYGEVNFQMAYKGADGKPFDWLYIDFESLSDIAQQYRYVAKQLFIEPDGQYLATLQKLK